MKYYSQLSRKVCQNCLHLHFHSSICNNAKWPTLRALSIDKRYTTRRPYFPILFVIAIEYLSRILKASSRSSRFSFHPRCKKLGLNHLIFADDLMLMSKRDSTSIQVLIERINLFSKASGLHANYNKSTMFLAGLSNEQKNSMARTPIPSR